MSRRLIALLIVAVGLAVALTLPSGRAAPGAEFRLEALLPARTVAFVSMEGIDTWQKKIEQTAIGKLCLDPEMQAFFKPFMDDAKKSLDDTNAKGVMPDGKGGQFFVNSPSPVVMKLIEQAKNLHGQVAVGLMDWRKQGGPVLAGSFDFGEHVSDFVAFLTKLRDEAQADEKGGGLPLKTSERNGRTYWEIAEPRGRSPQPVGPGGDPMAPPARGGGPDIAATTIGSAFVLSTDRAWLEGVADANGAPSPTALAGVAEFQGVREKAGGEGTMLFVYANVPEILSLAGSDGKMSKALNALGADTVKAAGYGLAFSGDGFLDTVIVHAPDAGHGILPLLRRRPVTHAALPLVPSSAFFFEEDTTALSTALPKIREIATKIDDDAMREIDKALAKVKDVTGVDAERELLGGLADDWAVYAGLPETGGIYPEVAFLVGVKDPANYEALLEKAVNGLAGDVTERERAKMSQRTLPYHGTRLHVIELDAAKKRDMIPFTPTWAMVKDRLVVTLVPHTMKEIVLRAEAGGSGGLSSQEDFQALLRVMPEGSGSFSYVDTQALFSMAYDTLVPIAQTAGKPSLLGIPARLDWAQLPAARTVRPYLRSLASFSTVDSQGFRLSVHSPIGMMPFVAVAGAAAFATMGMARGHAMDELSAARRSATSRIGGGPDDPSMNLLKAHILLETTSARLELYRAEHGALPDSLADLAPKGSPSEPALDPWGNELRYRVIDAKEGTSELRSAGPNGVFGDEDDVVTNVSPGK